MILIIFIFFCLRKVNIIFLYAITENAHCAYRFNALWPRGNANSYFFHRRTVFCLRMISPRTHSSNKKGGRHRRPSIDHNRHARSSFAYDGFTAFDPGPRKKKKHLGNLIKEDLLEKLPVVGALMSHDQDHSSHKNLLEKTNMLSRIKTTANTQSSHNLRTATGTKNQKNSYLLLLESDVDSEELSTRLKLRRYLATSSAGFLLDMFNCFFSILSCFLYILETYYADNDIVFNILDVALCGFFVADYAIRLFIADARVLRDVHVRHH